MKKELFKFGVNNSKLKDTITFSKSSGLTCPGSSVCKAWAVMNAKTNKRELKRGNESLFTCFAASEDLRYTKVFNSLIYNYITC